MRKTHLEILTLPLNQNRGGCIMDGQDAIFYVSWVYQPLLVSTHCSYLPPLKEV